VAGLRKAGGTVETNYTARELLESYAGSAGTQGLICFVFGLGATVQSSYHGV
jgi:hypothetical protein